MGVGGGNFVCGFAVVDPDGGGYIIVFAEGVDNVDAGLDLAGAVDIGIGNSADQAIAGFFDAAVDEGVEHPELDQAEFAVHPGFNEIHAAAGVGIHGELLFFEIADLGGQGFFGGHQFIDPGFTPFDHILVAQDHLEAIDFGLQSGLLQFEYSIFSFGDSRICSSSFAIC